MTHNELELRVKHIIAEQLSLDIDNRDILEENGLLTEDYGADSLDIVEITMALEEEFDIEITEPDILISGTSTVGSILELVDRKIKEKGEK